MTTSRGADVTVIPSKKSQIEGAKGLEALSCDTVFEEDEWKVLAQLYQPKGHKKKAAPSMKWAYGSLAKLGGFNDTKRTGMASWTTLWEGWDKLQAHVSGYRLAKTMFEAGEKL